MTNGQFHSRDNSSYRNFDSSKPPEYKNPRRKLRLRARTFLLRGAICVLVVALTASVISIVAQQQPTVQPPLRGEAPTGYDAYSAVVEPEFSKAVAVNVSSMGNDPATGGRTAGSPAEYDAALFIEQTMKDIGLQNVTVDQAGTDGWVFKGAQLDYKDVDGNARHALLGGYQTTIVADNEYLPIVFLGNGTLQEYGDLDVTGKLVLIENDAERDWRINLPAYQAKLKGAKALIAVSVMSYEIGDRISSGDIRGAASAPVLSIGKDDADAIRAAIEQDGLEFAEGQKQLGVRLTADSRVTTGTHTNNVWGEIPGRTDEVVYFSAHYDGYYHGFFDDAIGVGLMLDIAKSFIQSGYKPIKTLRFLATGAGEWGRIESSADWMTGAYEQVTNVHPEWAKNAFAMLSLEDIYPLNVTKNFRFSVPFELGEFMNERIASFGDRSKFGMMSEVGFPGTIREDFVYTAAGIPTISCESVEGGQRYAARMAHSNTDTLANGGYYEEAIACIENFYGYSVLMLDQLPLQPLNFTARVEAFRASYEEGNPYEPIVDAHMRANVERLLLVAEQVDRLIDTFNQDYMMAIAAQDTALESAMIDDAQQLNNKIFATYKLMQGELLRLNPSLRVGFVNDFIQDNLSTLNSAIEILEQGDVVAAVSEQLSSIDFVRNALFFDKETCDYFVKDYLEKQRGTWAEGRMVSAPIYADDVVRSLQSKMTQKLNSAEEQGNTESGSTKSGDAEELNYMEEIEALRTLATEQRVLLSGIYSGQSTSCAKIADAMYAIIDAKAELDDAKEEQQSLAGA